MFLSMILFFSISNKELSVNMLKIIFTLLILSCSLLSRFEVLAQENTIIAIIDETPITQKELEDRGKINIYFLKKQNNAISVNSKDTLKELIKEYIIIDKGSAFGLNVSDEEINYYIERLEEANKMSKNSLKSIFEQNNLSFSSYLLKIRSDIILNKVAKGIFEGSSKASQADMYDIILDSNNANSVLFKYRLYSTQNLNNNSFKTLLSLKNQIKDCNFNKQISKSINFVENEGRLSSLETGIRVLLADAKENIPTNIIRKKDNYDFYVVCAKIFPPISSQQESNIRNYIDIEKVKVRIAKILQQWHDDSSIQIFN